MPKISIPPAQRWKGWFISGLTAYLIQGLVWVVFGFAYSVWKEVWGGGLIEGREEMIAEGVLVASPVGSIIGTTLVYAMIGFMIAGLIHMLAYIIPGGLFWGFTKPNSLLLRRPWVSWLIGWALGATAMGFYCYGEVDWIWSATLVGGPYGILTAVTCCTLGARITGLALPNVRGAPTSESKKANKPQHLIA